MKINVLKYCGYCAGVKAAISKIDSAILNENTKKPIYMLTPIIHNKDVINDYIQKGIILLNDYDLSNIKEGTIIISAHGISDKLYNQIKDIGLDIIDTTCGYVQKTHNNIKENLDKNILYICNKNHTEAIGTLGLSDKIIPIEKISDLDNLNLNGKIYVTSQTTLSDMETSPIINKIKEKYNDVIIDAGICNTSTLRQNNILNQPKADYTIIIGDKTSSNANRLYMLSKSKYNTIFVENENDIDKSIFKENDIINIASSASTPDYTVDKIIKYLK